MRVLVVIALVGVAACTSPVEVTTGQETPSRGRAVEVERVIDGDSVELVVDGEPLEVRLVGINAPELFTAADERSCPGFEARRALEELLAGGPVGFVAGDQDRFGRTLGELVVDGRSVNRVLVEEGWALALWTADDPTATAAMRTAADERRGLWGDGCGAPEADGIRLGDAVVDPPGNDRQALADEWVEVVNEGSEPVDLSRWTLRDETSSNRFALGGVTLGPGEAIRVRTGSGRTGGGDLYLGESFPVWSNRGETILVLDPAGVVADHRFIDP
ncbi:MAG: lamin tail domain-containing protein [Acidimicrobiales bacterium]